MGEISFWYRPTRVVPDQRPLNGRCCLMTALSINIGSKVVRRIWNRNRMLFLPQSIDATTDNCNIAGHSACSFQEACKPKSISQYRKRKAVLTIDLSHINGDKAGIMLQLLRLRNVSLLAS